MSVIRSRIDGEFEGFDGDALFRLANGQIWQQVRYRYKYRYKYRPHIEIRREGSKYMMYVPFMGESIQVKRVE